VQNSTSPTIGPGLSLTGERTLPGIPHENYWFRRHAVAYRAVLPYVRYADVLDAGSGEGYGGELLRSEADARVVALDLDERTVGHVRSAYPGLHPVRGSLSRLPFADGAFDAVVGMHVIEHVWDQKPFVRECSRMLRPVGTLLLSTINQLTAPREVKTAGQGGAGQEVGAPGSAPGNPHHTRELTPDELVDLLDSWFNVTRVLGVRHGYRIRDWEAEHGPVVDGQLAGPPQTWSEELRELVASVTDDDFVVGPADVDEALDLLVVAVRR
jgi:2-polyprenyl-3-methyl-5-hydroxy-6-metoxy-1,4-benzoquinol methylase